MDDFTPQRGEWPRGCALGCLTLGFALFAFAGLMGVAVNPGAVFPFAVFGLLATGVGVYGLLRVQQTTLLDYRIEVEPSALRFNDTARVTVTVVAKKRAPLTSGHLALRCREHAISRGGTSDSHYRHLVHNDQRLVSVDRRLEAGEALTFTEEFLIPEGLPASFHGRNNFIEWHLDLHLGLAGPLLDVREERPVTVVPEVV